MLTSYSPKHTARCAKCTVRMAAQFYLSTPKIRNFWVLYIATPPKVGVAMQFKFWNGKWKGHFNGWRKPPLICIWPPPEGGWSNTEKTYYKIHPPFGGMYFIVCFFLGVFFTAAPSIHILGVFFIHIRIQYFSLFTIYLTETNPFHAFNTTERYKTGVLYVGSQSYIYINMHFGASNHCFF